MSSILSRLQALKTNIRVGLIGIGNIGKGILYQTTITPGIECVAIADSRMGAMIEWVEELQLEYKIVTTTNEMHDAISQGRLVVCENGQLIAQCDYIDVLVDSSSSITGGLLFAQTGIQHHKHIVMMNSEADLIFGPYLMDQANKEGVVYTSADGDQHTVLKRLINQIEFWGFQTVMAGNMKGYLDRYSNPTKIIPEADKRDLDYIMCTSYTDGTKLAIENALVANAINGKTIISGMRGPRVNDIYDVFNCFDFEKLWDGKRPLVDYVFRAYPPGGVFVIGFTDHPHQMKTLGWYPCRLGDGPFYLFHRPYHLGHFESLACIAEAYLDGWALLQPSYGLVTNVYTYAKRDLSRGAKLDGIGGYAAYGMIENCSDNQEQPGLPICLADELMLKHDVPKDEKILLEDVIYDPYSPEFEVYLMETSRNYSGF